MSYSKAVWYEKGNRVSGTIVSSWIIDDIVYYPTKDVYNLLLKKRKPKDDWYKFPLEKVEMTDDDKKLVDDYEFVTTAPEDGEISESDKNESDSSENEPPLKKVYPSKKKREKEKTVHPDKENKCGSSEKNDNSVRGTLPRKKTIEKRHINYSLSGKEQETDEIYPKRKVLKNTSEENCQNSDIPVTKSQPLVIKSPSSTPKPVVAKTPFKGHMSPAARNSFVGEEDLGNAEPSGNAGHDFRREDNSMLLSSSFDAAIRPPSSGSYPWPSAKFQDRVIFLLTENRMYMRKIMAKLGGDGNARIGEARVVLNEREEVKNLTSVEELELYEVRLEEKEERERLVSFLSNCGGDSCEQGVRLMYRKLMSNVLLSNLNLLGRGSKKGITKTKCYKIIEEIAIKTFKKTEKDVRNIVGNMLKSAPDRPGGTGRKSIDLEDNEP